MWVSCKVGSGQRYQILSQVFASCTSQTTHCHARLWIACVLRAILAWPCVVWLAYVQKSVTQILYLWPLPNAENAVKFCKQMVPLSGAMKMRRGMLWNIIRAIKMHLQQSRKENIKLKSFRCLHMLIKSQLIAIQMEGRHWQLPLICQFQFLHFFIFRITIQSLSCETLDEEISSWAYHRTGLITFSVQEILTQNESEVWGMPA